MPFRHLLEGSTSLSDADIARLGELVAEWQLLADISFADLVLWVPRRTDDKSWPEGHLAIAQIRPMTAATVFTQDLIGDEVSWDHGRILTMLCQRERLFAIVSQNSLANFLSRKRQFQFSIMEK